MGPALPVGPFRCIVADPPWRYTYSTRKSDVPGTGWLGAGENHYDTMTVAEIESMPVGSVAARDAICFLWVVNPMLPRCVAVLAAWGFEYRGLITWAKTDRRTGTRPFFGNGYWARGATEHMAFGVRGDMKPASRKEVTWFSAPVRGHSEKPNEAFEVAARIAGDGPRLELFARGPRPGWTVWGNESEGRPGTQLPLRGKTAT